MNGLCGDGVVGGVPCGGFVFDEDQLGGLVLDVEAGGKVVGNGAGFDDFNEVGGGRGLSGGFDVVEYALVCAGGDGAAGAVFKDEDGPGHAGFEGGFYFG